MEVIYALRKVRCKDNECSELTKEQKRER